MYRTLVFGYKAVLNRGVEHAGIKEDPMTNHKVYRIKLTTEERDTFAQVAKGKRGRLKIAAWKVQRANAMLMCDEGDQGPCGCLLPGP